MRQAPQVPDALIAVLRDAQRPCVLTGAGVSAESGVPTFRDAQTGLWARYDPLALATPDAFASDPALIWAWYRWRRELVLKAAPNPAHMALASMGKVKTELTLITQNVDGLHQRAGSHDVIEFHGNLFKSRCSNEACVNKDRSLADDQSSEVPQCSDCGANLRPGVVWFGESIPEAALSTSFAAAADCDLFLSIGTSSLVHPAAGLVDVAHRNGATSVEINPNPTAGSHNFDYQLQGNAGLILPKLLESLPARHPNRDSDE